MHHLRAKGIFLGRVVDDDLQNMSAYLGSNLPYCNLGLAHIVLPLSLLVVWPACVHKDLALHLRCQPAGRIGRAINRAAGCGSPATTGPCRAARSLTRIRVVSVSGNSLGQSKRAFGSDYCLSSQAQMLSTVS